MNYTQNILKKIASNKEVVGIIGLGYVGLPLAVNFAQAGVKVIGFDNMFNGHLENLNAAFRNPNFTFFKGDVRDYESLKKVVSDLALKLKQKRKNAKLMRLSMNWKLMI